ncbi:MAG: M12 family metallo-peptidase [Proteobacteria bacterium]|nr:M12 family metallo-peptidase [Pseudomonadota bacterium]
MQITLGALGPVELDSAAKVGASRKHGSPLATVTSYTLGAPTTRVVCNCLQCQAAGLAEGARVAAASGVSSAPASARTAAAAATVDYTDSIKKSGRITTDALLAGGNRWFHDAGASGAQPSATAKKTLTYSFIENAAGLSGSDANGFQALDGDQRERVRDTFQYLSTLIDVSFTEVSGGGDIQYGSNAQASSAGYARYPNEGSQVFLANNQAGFHDDWDEGSYSWQVLLHETGHALGLKHPGNYNAGGGGTAGPYLSGSADNRGNTIMSYHDAKDMTRIEYEGGAFSKTQVNAGSYQAYDIQALQYLYGAATTAGAQSYSWASDQAMSATVWNPNAGSEIDLSNQSGRNVVDLRAGKRSSIGVVDPYSDMPFSKAEYAKLKSGGKTITSLIGKPTYTGQNNLTIAAGSQFTRAVGGSGSDSFVANPLGGALDGGAGDDSLYWTGGNLQAVGGSGNDTLLLKKVSGATWSVAGDGSSATLTKRDKKTGAVTTLASLTMSGIESVRYWNGSALKATGAALYAGAGAPGFSATA